MIARMIAHLVGRVCARSSRILLAHCFGGRHVIGAERWAERDKTLVSKSARHHISTERNVCALCLREIALREDV